ncbi:YvrJ family protein [Sporolactobacillus vineae]|uniref:YvrJ family protein n=1 Tax=Sporolactobacillus vineae TaxID=444463 RepID=UPI000288E19E|nr:YvrJ family protein [Sporolactobacillus vineae]
MEVWLPMIRDIGFPAVVTFFLLYRIEGKLDELIQSVRALPGVTAAGRPEEPAIREVKKQG